MSVPESIIINGHEHILYSSTKTTIKESRNKSQQFLSEMQMRRSIRGYSDQKVPKEIIENIIMTASSAPSGANKQPWTFVAVANPDIKHQIRSAAEAEERESYANRMSDRWLKDLEPLGTDANKEFLDVAPWLMVVFKRVFDYDENGNKTNNYYVNESVGIACGMLISAIHQAGLVTLTHTPSPMNFLSKILNRPENEKPYLLLPIGFPKTPVYVPKISKKSLGQVAEFF